MCDLCRGSEVETLKHFLLDCVSLRLSGGGAAGEGDAGGPSGGGAAV